MRRCSFKNNILKNDILFPNTTHIRNKTVKDQAQRLNFQHYTTDGNSNHAGKLLNFAYWNVKGFDMQSDLAVEKVLTTKVIY